MIKTILFAAIASLAINSSFGESAAPASGNTTDMTLPNFFASNGMTLNTRALAVASKVFYVYMPINQGNLENIRNKNIELDKNNKSGDKIDPESFLSFFVPTRWSSIGIAVNAAPNISSQSVIDDISSQLLFTDSAFLSGYLSPLQGDSNALTAYPEHPFATDKNYLTDITKGAPVEGRGFMRSGIGAKGFKPGGPLALDAVGTAYIGFGFDGPTKNIADKVTGYFDLEGYVTENILNKTTLEHASSLSGLHSTYSTYCIQFNFTNGSAKASFYYGASLGNNNREVLRPVIGFSLSLTR